MFYKYKVGWYDCCDDGKEEYSEGVVVAADWGQAANRVSNSYGKDLIFEMSIYEVMCNDEADYCLSKEDIKHIFKED
jgi:hypothetical protein